MNRKPSEPSSPPPIPRRGDPFPERELRSLGGGQVRIPDATKLVHLQLRRYAGCPICSLHLRSFARRHAELEQAGILEVAVFHSSFEELTKVHAEQPFAVVPDPDKLFTPNSASAARLAPFWILGHGLQAPAHYSAAPRPTLWQAAPMACSVCPATS